MTSRPVVEVPGPLALIEEAVALVRAAPAATLLSYYLGALPFALGLLWFWIVLSTAPDAARRLPAAALGLTLLFAWMKAWQALFTRQLLAGLCGDDKSWPGLREFLRLAAVQLCVQPFALFLLPLSLVLIATFPFVCAFFQNVTTFAARPGLGTRELVAQAAREAIRWPGTHLKALLALGVFALFVLVNVAMGVLLVPALLKMLLGVESVFSRSSASALNYTTLLVVFLLTWLGLDPVLKAFYLLRCFHGESVRTGQDLRAQLRRVSASVLVALAVLVVASPGRAETAAERQPASAGEVAAGEGTRAPTAVAASELDRAIADTLDRPEYRWRGSGTADESAAGWLSTTLDNLLATLRDWAERFLEWLRDLLRKLFRMGPGMASGGGGVSLTGVLLIVLILVLAVLVGLAIFRLLHVWQPAPVVVAQPLAALPDLALEDAHAAQLPADGWTRLALELLQRGELRLALRALYLAQLAQLAGRGLLTLARFKSNRDYQRELDRRAHAVPGLARQFADNIHLVDRVWYGRHPVDRTTVERFAASLEARPEEPATA